MIVSLQGLLDDGSDRSPLVPATSVATIELPIGITATIRMTVVTVARMPVRLTGTTFKLTVKKSFLDATPLFTLIGAASGLVGPNVVDFALTPAITKPLSPGRYVFDVWRTVTATGARDQLVQLSSFILLPASGLP